MILFNKDSTNRQEEFNEFFKITPFDPTNFDHEVIRRLTLDYDRYHEANMLAEYLDKGPKLKILEFGCGVSDYGLVLRANGHEIVLADVPTVLDFALYRHKKYFEKDMCKIYCGDQVIHIAEGFDLILTAESFDHVSQPFETLLEFDGHAPWLVTTGYPFKYKTDGKHSFITVEQAPACEKFLRDNYNIEVYPSLEERKKFFICKKKEK